MTMRNVKKRLIVLLMLTVAITVLPVTTASGASTAMHGSTYSITTSVISGGGGVMTSDSYQMQATIGQPSPLMEQTSPPYSAFHDLYPGFSGILWMLALPALPWQYLLLLSVRWREISIIVFYVTLTGTVMWMAAIFIIFP